MDATISIYKILSRINKDILSDNDLDALIKSFGKDASIVAGYVFILQNEGYIKPLLGVESKRNWSITVSGIKYLIEIEDKMRTERIHRTQMYVSILAVIISLSAIIISAYNNGNNRYNRKCWHQTFWRFK